LKSRGHRSDAGEPPLLIVEWELIAAGDGEPAPSLSSVKVIAFVAGEPVRRGETVLRLEDEVSTGVVTLGPVDPGPLELGLTWAPIEPPHLPPDRSPDTLLVLARAGSGPLLVSEFLYHPDAGGPEWIELVNAGRDSVATARCSLADGRLEPVVLEGAPDLGPGDLLVVAEAALPGLPLALILGSRWPALNDAGDPADRIRILDDLGRTSDDVAYAGSWAAAGVSVERRSATSAGADPAAWSAAPFGPTPGRPNGAARESPPGREFLRVERPPATPGSPPAILLWLAEPLRDGALSVHALDGRLVRRFAGGLLAGRRFLVWDGRDQTGSVLPAGLYLLSLAGERALGGAAPPASVSARATLLVTR
jgi:hypothetical protein